MALIPAIMSGSACLSISASHAVLPMRAAPTARIAVAPREGPRRCPHSQARRREQRDDCADVWDEVAEVMQAVGLYDLVACDPFDAALPCNQAKGDDDREECNGHAAGFAFGQGHVVVEQPQDSRDCDDAGRDQDEYRLPKGCEIFGAGMSKIAVIICGFGRIGDGGQPAERHHQVHRAAGQCGRDCERSRLPQRPKFCHDQDQRDCHGQQPCGQV